METKKYKLLENDTREADGRTLHRIEAVRSFGDVYEGDKGGYVESEENLSHEGTCWVSGNAKVYDDAMVCDSAVVYDSAIVLGSARVLGDAEVGGDAKVFGDAEVGGDARVYGNAKVFGDAIVYGDARVFGDAEVKGADDYIVFKNWWSSGRYFTWTRSNNMWRVGCFYGTGEELVKKAYADSELSGREYERVVKYVEETLRDEREK